MLTLCDYREGEDSTPNSTGDAEAQLVRDFLTTNASNAYQEFQSGSSTPRQHRWTTKTLSRNSYAPRR